MKPPFDLGNLTTLKVGDEVTILDLKGKVCSTVYLVHALPEWGVQVKRADARFVSGYWHHNNNGGGTWTMYNQSVMRYWYSANPVHIAQAKANAEAARIAEETKRATFAKLLALAKPIGEALGDGEQWHGDEHIACDEIAQTLAERLTPEQMNTLAGWLGLEVAP